MLPAARRVFSHPAEPSLALTLAFELKHARPQRPLTSLMHSGGSSVQERVVISNFGDPNVIREWLQNTGTNQAATHRIHAAVVRLQNLGLAGAATGFSRYNDCRRPFIEDFLHTRKQYVFAKCAGAWPCLRSSQYVFDAHAKLGTGCHIHRPG